VLLNLDDESVHLLSVDLQGIVDTGQVARWEFRIDHDTSHTDN
jgi:hypothetical protein